MTASRYPALARALGERSLDKPTIHDAATAAVEHKNAGSGVDPEVASRVGAHLGVDFSAVRVHDDPLAQQATAAMGARAFAYDADVFLGPGESGRDLGLMAHELTHVAQQGAASQRAVARAVRVGDASSPAEREADQVSADVTGGHQPSALLVDQPPVGTGQMLKSEFLERLRAQVTAAADAELGPIYSGIGCPYIEQYFNRYAGQPASASEALLRRFAPATRAARTAADLIPPVVARVREGTRQWRDTGQPPPDLAAIAPAQASAGPAAPTAATQAQALRAPDGAETLASLEADLGPGRPLDSATADRMSHALHIDLPAVHIHTGPVAARKAADAGAIAFTVGTNVVMGAGAPSAGTLEGDALLAHELVHVGQQASAAADPAASRLPIRGEDSAAEEHADAASLGALARLLGGTRGLAARAATSLRTGVQLQRCSTSTTPAPTGYVPPGSVASGKDRLAGTGQVSETEKDDIDKTVLNPAGGGIGKAADPFIKKDFEAHMVKALNDWRTAILTSRKRLTGPDAYKLDMPQVRKTGEAAQQVVTAKYGEYVSGATFSADTNARKPGYDVGSTSVLHEQKETVAGLSASEKLKVATGLTRYASKQAKGGGPVMTTHHVDGSRAPDLLEYTRVVQDYAQKHTDDLVEIQRTWPGEEHPGDGTVYIRLENIKDPKLSAQEKKKTAGFEDANLRRGYWKSFRTLIHEYLHACAHIELRLAAATRKGNTHQILVEGGADYFTEKVWNGVEPTLAGDDALREKVEGKKYAYSKDVIGIVTSDNYYDEVKDVKQIIAKLGGKGEANFAAAYFMGHVELIGLGNWKKDREKDADTFIAPVNDFPLADVAKRCNVDEASVATANGLAIGDKVAQDKRLKVPGVRHHIAISGDTLADIASQNGVTEAAVKQANPVTSTPFSGQDILIPVH